jgi:CBS domain-containing protein
MSARRAERKASLLTQLARVLVRFDYVASFIVNANHSIGRAWRSVGNLPAPHEIEHNEFARVERKRGEIAESGMQLREIMTRDVEVIRPETSVSEAAQKMRSLDLDALPVCEGQRLVGMVTDRYITIRATAYGHDPNTAPVRNYMSSDLICCFEDQDIKEAVQLMRQTRVRRLPVLTREKHVAGIVALDDLASRAVGLG